MWTNLKQAIDSAIRTNDNQEITGAVLNSALKTIVDTVGANATYAGIATPSVNPGTPDGPVFYFAAEAGTYSNFGGAVVKNGLTVLYWDGVTWSATSVFNVDYVPTPGSNNFVKSGGVAASIVFDISVYHATGSILATYANLAAALGTDGENVPASVRKGGMSVKFVQTSDNKYVQYRLTSQNFSITISDWEEDESILQLKCLEVFPSSAARVCRGISTNDLVCKIILEDFYIYGKNELNSYPWEEFYVAGNEYTLQNMSAIVANTTNNTVSVENIELTTNLYNAVQGSDKVLLFINCLGKLYSPIPSLQNELEYLYYTEGYEASVASQLGSIESKIELIKSQFAVGNGIVNGDIYKTNIFKSIEKSGYNVAVELNAFNIFGTYKNPNWQEFNPGTPGTFTIPNVNALIADIDTNSLLVTVMEGATFHQYMTNKRYVAICINYLGRLYSAIPSVQYELDMFYEKEKEKNPYYEHTVVVASSDGDYTRVRDAVNAITDASEYNRYKVLVKNGTYNEIDIETKDYVDIVGESRDGVVLVCDGLSSSLAPNGYGRPMWEWLEDYSGQPISSIPKAYKHLFIHMSKSKISDLTMLVNNVKYAVHQDGNERSYEALIENCDIIRRETYDNEIPSSLVGVGAEGGQNQKYVNCNFYMEVDGALADDYYCAVLWHNWNNQAKECVAVLDGCNIYGCHVARISELGSEQNDKIIIKNTIVDKPQYGIIYCLEMGHYKINGQVVTDPTLVPYSIQLDVVSSHVNYILCSKDRLNAYEHKINDSNSIELDIINGISIGQPISPINMFGSIGAIIATDNNFVFTTTSPNSKYFVKANKGAVGLGLCIAGSYSYGDDMYILNGKFTNVLNGNKVGVCLESITIQNDELVRIQRT